MGVSQMLLKCVQKVGSDVTQIPLQRLVVARLAGAGKDDFFGEFSLLFELQV